MVPINKFIFLVLRHSPNLDFANHRWRLLGLLPRHVVFAGPAVGRNGDPLGRHGRVRHVVS